MAHAAPLSATSMKKEEEAGRKEAGGAWLKMVKMATAKGKVRKEHTFCMFLAFAKRGEGAEHEQMSP